MELFVAYFANFIGFFTIRYFALSKKSNLLHVLSVVYVLGVCVITFVYILQTAFIHPFGKEVITQGIVLGREKGSSGSNYFTKYEYYVNGEKYEGGFGLYNKYCMRYKLGDTIDVTYDEQNPSESIATYQQYWYVNKDREEYWLKMKRGDGCRSNY